MGVCRIISKVSWHRNRCLESEESLEDLPIHTCLIMCLGLGLGKECSNSSRDLYRNDQTNQRPPMKQLEAL